MSNYQAKSFDVVGSLNGEILNIKDILSRIPGLADIYEKTFGEPAKNVAISLHDLASGIWEFRIDDGELYYDRKSLVELVHKWRRKHPFLDNWHFGSAEHAWGKSVLIFRNYDKVSADDLADDVLVESKSQFYTRVPGRNTLELMSIIPPLSGGIVHEHSSIIEAYKGVTLSEHSLQFLGSFLLGSLVRYRPQIWQHAISRSFSAQSPADDRCLALIEKFLDLVLTSYPQLVVRAVDYLRVR